MLDIAINVCYNINMARKIILTIIILTHILNYKYIFYTTTVINYQFAGCDVIGYPNTPNISKLLYVDIKTSNQVKRNKFYFELYEEKIFIDKNGNKQGKGKYKSWCFKGWTTILSNEIWLRIPI